MTRYLSVRVEVEVSEEDPAELNELGWTLADRAKRAIEHHPRVVDIQHAAFVTRRP